MSSTSPNMGLIIPTVSVELGPEWASLLNACLAVIDSHTHQPGSGVKITPAAININAALEMNSYDLSEVNSILLDDRLSDISSRGIFAKNGELQYRDSAGNVVTITASGSVNAGPGSITNLTGGATATYVSGSKQFKWEFASSKYARMANADISLFPYDASTAYTKSIAIKAPTDLEANSAYSMTLPTIVPPSVAELVTMSTAGVLDHATIAGTSNQVSVSASATAVTISLPTTVATSLFSAGDGSAAAPAFTFTSDADTGIYRKGSNNLGFAAGGVAVGDYNNGDWTFGIAAAQGTHTFRGVPVALGIVGSPNYFKLDNTANVAGKVWRIGATGGSGGSTSSFDIYNETNNYTLATLTPAGSWTWGQASGTDIGHIINLGDVTYASSSGSGGLRIVGTVRSILTLEASDGSPQVIQVRNTSGTQSGLSILNSSGVTVGATTDAGAWTFGTGAQAHTVSGSLTVSSALTASSTLAVTGALTASSTLSVSSTLTASGAVALSAGLVGTPSLTFTGDLNTGIYSTGADTIDFATAGVQRMSISSAGRARFSDGNSGAPGISFIGDTDTGMYTTGANTLDFSTGANRAMSINSGSQILVGDGTGTAPVLSFISDTDTGFFRNGANDIGIACAGSAVGAWSSSRLDIATPISMSGSGGSATAHKTTIVTGTIASGATVTAYTGSIVYGAYGWAGAGGTTFAGIGQTITGTTTDVVWGSTGSSTAVVIKNDGAGTRTYRVVVIHA